MFSLWHVHFTCYKNISCKARPKREKHFTETCSASPGLDNGKSMCCLLEISYQKGATSESIFINFHNLKMSYFRYHWCAVPECMNTSVKSPDMLWIQVPTEINMRKTWFKLAKRDPEQLSKKTRLYFCEDHFDLENDMENYTRYKIMGSVKRIRLKPHCIPSRFDWNRKHKSASNESHLALAKRPRIYISKENIQDYIEENSKISSFCIEDSQTPVDVSSMENKCDKAVLIIQVQEHIAIQGTNNDNQRHRHTQHDTNQGPQFTFPIESEIKTEYIQETDPLENENVIKEEYFPPIQDTEEENKCTIFGNFVAQKLSQLSHKNRSIAQKQIGNILYALEMKDASFCSGSESETLSNVEEDDISDTNVSVKIEVDPSSDFSDD